ncbi:MAG: hypothetical protein JW704_07320 [Anaerolineaceae bacterium]|nr:hypothetical protein [Anaerolineaceae bacterium]
MSDKMPEKQNRLGFHYYPDTLHYRESDLRAWLPELQSLGAGWLVLTAAADHAIPEVFISGLLAGGIQPVIHFKVPIPTLQKNKDLPTLLGTYARWGIRYVILSDQPNANISWSAATWAQEDLVERYLDICIPLAESAIQLGLVPVFPPPEPGGSYWDTTFLQSCLQSIMRRQKTALLDSLVISAYSWTGGKPLSYGAGGPERWAGARPYFTPEGEEDQRGFHIHEWYHAIIESVTGKTLPLMLLGAGYPGETSLAAINPAEHATINLAIVQALSGSDVPDPSANGKIINALPDYVINLNLAWLTAAEDSPASSYAWFRAGGNNLPVVGALRQWQSARSLNYEPVPVSKTKPASPIGNSRFISHYILLPSYEWGVSDWHLDVVKPFVKKYQTTIGFSIDEAKHAARVTVIGNAQSIPEEIVDQLRLAGCLVERISGDGTSIASQLSER